MDNRASGDCHHDPFPDIVRFLVAKDCRQTFCGISVECSNEGTNCCGDGSANCVGYAQLGASICNYAFDVNGSPSKAKAVVGDVKFWGISVCGVLRILMPNERWRNFVKDHDFVEIGIEKSIIYVDPSLYDFHIDCTTVVRKK